MKTPIGDSPEQSRLNPNQLGTPEQLKTLTLHNINEHQKELQLMPNPNQLIKKQFNSGATRSADN